ncbi:MAG: tetratricopeptide repeat protein, partial [Anaerolineae bacterium]
LVAAALMVLIALQTAAGRVGLAIFVAFMVPALALAPRPASRFLTDNALYMPVLALAMVLLPGLAQIARTRVPPWEGRADWAALGLATVVAVALALGTRAYSSVWASDLALWIRATQVAPGSAYAWTRAGVAAHRVRENLPARRYLQRAIELQPTADAYLAAAEVALDTGRPGDAIDAMNLLVAVQPGNAGAYERLALAYQAQRDFDSAAQALENGIAAAPSRTCAFTTNLGVIRYLQGDKDAARRDLEAARGMVGQEDNPICLLSLFHLGQLYHEMDRDTEARAAIEEYLARTEALRDDVTRADRAAAMQLLGQLSR